MKKFKYNASVLGAQLRHFRGRGKSIVLARWGHTRNLQPTHQNTHPPPPKDVKFRISEQRKPCRQAIGISRVTPSPKSLPQQTNSADPYPLASGSLCLRCRRHLRVTGGSLKQPAVARHIRLRAASHLKGICPLYVPGMSNEVPVHLHGHVHILQLLIALPVPHST